MSIAVDRAGREDKHMLRVSPLTTLHQCENGVMCTGLGEQETKEEQSAGDQEEMEAHLRFLNMDLEMEVLDLESCLTFGEDIHAQAFQDQEATTPRLSLRAELAKARRGKLAENLNKVSNETTFQEMTLKDCSLTHPSTDAAAEPSPGETSSEPPEYILSSADRMQVDSLLLPEPFEPSEEEMLIRDRDLSSFQNALDAGCSKYEEKREAKAEYGSRQKRKISLDEVSGKRLRSESEPWREECNAETLLKTPGSGNKKDKENQSAEGTEEKRDDSPTDGEGLLCRRSRNGESETPSATNSVRQPSKRSQKSNGSYEDSDARQCSTVVNTDTERDPDGLSACMAGEKKAHTDPPKLLRIKQVGMLRVKRKLETRSDRSGRKAVNVQDTTAAKVKEESGATDQSHKVIDIDDSQSPSDEKQEAHGVARKPETRSDRKKKMSEAHGQSVESAKVDTEGATAKRRHFRVTRTRPKLDVSSVTDVDRIEKAKVESSDRVTDASDSVKPKLPPARRSGAEKVQDDTQVLVTIKAPVIKGSKIQRKRGVYVGP